MYAKLQNGEEVDMNDYMFEIDDSSELLKLVDQLKESSQTSELDINTSGGFEVDQESEELHGEKNEESVQKGNAEDSEQAIRKTRKRKIIEERSGTEDKAGNKEATEEINGECLNEGFDETKSHQHNSENMSDDINMPGDNLQEVRVEENETSDLCIDIEADAGKESQSSQGAADGKESSDAECIHNYSTKNDGTFSECTDADFDEAVARAKTSSRKTYQIKVNLQANEVSATSIDLNIIKRNNRKKRKIEVKEGALETLNRSVNV